MYYEIKNLYKKYDIPVIENLNIKFYERENISIIGPSGCGKTTLINILSGILKPDSGKIENFKNKKISFIFQEDRLLPWFTALENVLSVNNNVQKADEVFKTLELTGCKNKLPNQLSGGMRQRVSIARAILFDGDIFILDEAFKGIDEKLKIKIMTILKEIVKDKLCISITHNLEEAVFFSDKIIIVSGPPLKIKKTIYLNKFKSMNNSELLENIRNNINLQENI